MSRSRLFIALELSNDAVGFLAEQVDELKRSVEKNWRWEPQNKYHLTIKFLGDTPVQKIESLKKLIADCEKFPPQVFSFYRYGTFGSKKSPAILWAGMKFLSDLHRVHEKIESEAESLGFVKEARPFKPHITLLRVKPVHSPDLINKIASAEMPANNFTANNLALFESVLHSSGSVYNKIFETKLIQ